MYKQHTPVSQSGSVYWRSSWSRVILPPHLSLHCQADTGEMVDIIHNWTLISTSIWKSFSDIRSSDFDDPTEFWLTAPGVAIGRCRIIKCQYPRTPLRGSIIVYIYNLYLVCHYLIREKNSTRQYSRERGHSSKRRRLKILSIEMLLWFLPPSYVWPGYARHIRLLTRHGKPLTLVNESGDKSRVQDTNPEQRGDRC